MKRRIKQVFGSQANKDSASGRIARGLVDAVHTHPILDLPGQEGFYHLSPEEEQMLKENHPDDYRRIIGLE